MAAESVMSQQNEIDRAIRQVQNGRIDEYETVVRAYERRLRGLLASLCPGSIDPNEIAQDAFVEAFGKIDYFEPGTNFYAWLSTFARNIFLERVRREKKELLRRRQYVEHMMALQFEQEAKQDLDLSSLRMDALNSCIEKLNESQFNLLQMRYEKRVAFSSLSQQFNTSVNALKVRLFGIRKKLRGCMQRYLEHTGCVK